MVIISNSVQEAESFLDGVLEKRLKKNKEELVSLLSSRSNYLPEFVCDPIARCIISGNPDKPISKKIFNSLRKAGKFATYYPSEGRTSYKVSELYTFIETTRLHIQTQSNNSKII